MLLGYARVSKSEKRGGTDIATQERDLTAAGCERLFLDDGVSGVVPLGRRRGWSAMVDYARPGDCILLTESTRLARNMAPAWIVVEGLLEQGIGVKFILGVDLSNAGPETITACQVQMVFAEGQRRVMVQRVNAGLARAREQGKVLGRRPAMTADKAAQAAELLTAGESQRRVAEAIGVSVNTLKAWRRNEGL